MWECFLYNFIELRFPSLFQNVALGNLKSFYQLDHHVDVDHCFIEVIALCYSREVY